MKENKNAVKALISAPSNTYIRPAGIPIEVLAHDQKCIPVIINGGDWVDLLTSKAYHLKVGDIALLDLGVSLKLPEHLEAHLIVRSSTFIKYGLIQTNGMGIIDNSYCGDNDVWKLPVYATRDVFISAYTRICQFRVIAKQPTLAFHVVDTLNSKDRGGFGSTGE
jgi:dUTP pyrophosphatase